MDTWFLYLYPFLCLQVLDSSACAALKFLEVGAKMTPTGSQKLSTDGDTERTQAFYGTSCLRLASSIANDNQPSRRLLAPPM